MTCGQTPWIWMTKTLKQLQRKLSGELFAGSGAWFVGVVISNGYPYL